MGFKSGDRITPPYTIYAVAMCYFHKAKDGRTVVFSHLEVVSGKSPLDGDEVKRRAEQAVRASWANRCPTAKQEEYELSLWDIQSSWIGRTE